MADSIAELAEQVRAGVTSVDEAIAEIQALGEDEIMAKQILARELGAKQPGDAVDELTPLPEYGL